MEDRTLLSTFLVTQHRRQRPRLAPPGDPRLQRRHRRHATRSTSPSRAGRADDRAGLAPCRAITQSVLIDGFSQPGYAGTPLIELSGSQAGGGDGLTITGSDVTVRGLAINGFSPGRRHPDHGHRRDRQRDRGQRHRHRPDRLAGPAQLLRRPRSSTAPTTTSSGGTDAAAGNLIAFNTGPASTSRATAPSATGSPPTGSSPTTISRPRSPAGLLQFDGPSYVSLPHGLINDYEQSETIEAWFQTTSGGVILGYPAGTDPGPSASTGAVPVLYVGTDGKLYGGSSIKFDLPGHVECDGQRSAGSWHHDVALVVDGVAQTADALPGWPARRVGSGSFPASAAASTRSGPDTPSLSGRRHPDRRLVRLRRPDRGRADLERWRTADEISQDMTTAPSGTEPGLEAYYPFDEGQGLTAHDLTPNHSDGTLAGTNGDLPTWVSAAAGHRPRRRRDHAQLHLAPPGTEQPPEFPDRRHHRRRPLEGWLGGSTPDTTYHIEFFASAGFAARAARGRPRSTSGRWR